MSIIYKGNVILSTHDSSKFYTPHQVSSKLWMIAKQREQLDGKYDDLVITNIVNCMYNSKYYGCTYDIPELQLDSTIITSSQN
jgi:hypothetical protein